MISGIFHAGSGIGNQLHRYVATRVLAADKGYDFSMIAPELSKVSSFMDLDMGIKADIPYLVESGTGRVVPTTVVSEWYEKTPYYNPEFNFIEDNTVIDGEFQDERYFAHRLDEVREWLKVEPINMPDDLCVIGFRGGEFVLYPDLFLPKEYWDEAISVKRFGNPRMRFEVHTDDLVLAHQFFPDFTIVADPELNWRSVRYAKHLIVANSSFYILPALLGDAHVIAPRYWARRNTQVWSMPQNYYHSFYYI